MPDMQPIMPPMGGKPTQPLDSGEKIQKKIDLLNRQIPLYKDVMDLLPHLPPNSPIRKQLEEALRKQLNAQQAPQDRFDRVSNKVEAIIDKLRKEIEKKGPELEQSLDSLTKQDPKEKEELEKRVNQWDKAAAALKAVIEAMEPILKELKKQN